MGAGADMTPAIIHIDGQPLGIRPAVASDVAWVMATFMESMLEHYPSRRRRKVALKLRPQAELDLADCGAVVACSPGQPDKIHGWACGNHTLLHYVYVPEKLRGFGLAQALIKACMREYPERIEVSRRWPWPSSGRFVLVGEANRAA